MDIRNIAIIAHVDHGKTTLVDALLRGSGTFAAHEIVEERVMDSNDQEKERGITIYAKNTAVHYRDSKINIVDTPGHADFGSEVERVLGMVDAALLVVDAYEGPMPQTKFVLQKSLQLGLKVLVVVNKIDKSTARPDEVINEVFDLFASLGATNEQLDFPHLYAIAREGVAIRNLDEDRKDITPLLDWILEEVSPAPKNESVPFRFQPATLAYDSFLGRIAVGRVREGTLKKGQNVFIKTPDGKMRKGKVTQLFTFLGLTRSETEKAECGDIIALAGISDIYVGETVTDNENTDPLKAISIDPPALAMDFMVNDSPLAGKEGKLVTSRNIRERLERELETNVGLKIEFSNASDSFKVYGRGEMHLAVLIEDMRREGFELQVSQPKVVFHEEDGVIHEPLENVIITVPEEMSGSIIEVISKRKGEMKNMRSEGGNTFLEFFVPTRGLLGFRGVFIILTKGEGTLYHSFEKYVPYLGKIAKRQVGSLISGADGEAIAYSLWNLQERGPLFIHPQTKVYEGMIIGEHNKGSDLTVNPLKEKKLTNVRASGKDDAINLVPPIEMTLEKAIEYINDDEYIEVTPLNIRLRKKYRSENERKRMGK
ncbi:translational GTPase TypA [Candidatus Peregrinibacteria bacterium]|nr:MAG: translational GTPase TypA [Candidatus Peregrinibacteria bacterium]